MSPILLTTIETVTIKGTLDYQACDDRVCFTPKSIPVSYTVKLRQLDTERVVPYQKRRCCANALTLLRHGPTLTVLSCPGFSSVADFFARDDMSASHTTATRFRIVTWAPVLLLCATVGVTGQQGPQRPQSSMPEPQRQANGVNGPWVWRYTPMRTPTFVPAAQAGFVKPEHRVMGLTVNGVSKAYQDFVVHEHHFVMDTIGGVPILLTWCGLCNSAMVYRNDVNGKPLTPDLAGLRGLNWVMKDRETGSYWQQSTGESFDGPHKGKRLQPINFVLTTFAEWRRRHPDTLVLVQDPTHAEGYKQMEQQHARGGLGGAFRAPASWGEKLRHDPRLPEREEILGIEINEGTKAYPIAAVRERSLINDRVGSVPVALVHTKQSDMVTSFVRTHRGRTLTFERAADTNLKDRETGSTWSPYGEAIAGPLKGTKLQDLTPAPHFWFGWAQFHPKTEVFGTNSTH